MRIIRKASIVISILLFGWLFFQTSNEIDLMSSYSRTLIREDISKIENSSNLNDLKEFSKSKIYQFQRINIEKSNLATKQTFIIFTLIAIQLFLYLSHNKSKPY
jgi:hypothetical protein